MNIEDMKLCCYGGINVYAKIDEDIDDILAIVTYFSNHDQYAVVMTENMELYEYGVYPNNDLSSSKFIRKPKAYIAGKKQLNSTIISGDKLVSVYHNGKSITKITDVKLKRYAVNTFELDMCQFLDTNHMELLKNKVFNKLVHYNDYFQYMMLHIYELTPNKLHSLYFKLNDNYLKEILNDIAEKAYDDRMQTINTIFNGDLDKYISI